MWSSKVLMPGYNSELLPHDPFTDIPADHSLSALTNPLAILDDYDSIVPVPATPVDLNSFRVPRPPSDLGSDAFGYPQYAPPLTLPEAQQFAEISDQPATWYSVPVADPHKVRAHRVPILDSQSGPHPQHVFSFSHSATLSNALPLTMGGYHSQLNPPSSIFNANHLADHYSHQDSLPATVFGDDSFRVHSVPSAIGIESFKAPRHVSPRTVPGDQSFMDHDGLRATMHNDPPTSVTGSHIMPIFHPHQAPSFNPQPLSYLQYGFHATLPATLGNAPVSSHSQTIPLPKTFNANLFEPQSNAPVFAACLLRSTKGTSGLFPDVIKRTRRILKARDTTSPKSRHSKSCSLSYLPSGQASHSQTSFTLCEPRCLSEWNARRLFPRRRFHSSNAP